MAYKRLIGKTSLNVKNTSLSMKNRRLRVAENAVEVTHLLADSLCKKVGRFLAPAFLLLFTTCKFSQSFAAHENHAMNEGNNLMCSPHLCSQSNYLNPRLIQNSRF